jgi:hypothetical protein
MTMLEKAITKKTLQALDRYRTKRGIRSRTKALEQMALEVEPEQAEHPFEVLLRNAPKLPKGSVPAMVLEQIKNAESEPSITLEEWKLKRLKRVRSA